jgi:hypothetical protein
MNTLDQVELIRDYIAEATASHWSDLNILRRLNVAQRTLAVRIAQLNSAWLVTSASVTPSATGVITLPNDCSKPLYLEDANGGVINWLVGGVKNRQVTRDGSEVYPLMNTLELNANVFSGTTCTLWYQKRVPDLHCGFTQSGSGANALVFDKTVTVAASALATGRALKFQDDYYNNVTVEVIDATSGIVDISSVISDYTASSATAVIVGTCAAADKYGTVSILPPECHELMVLETAQIALMKPGAKLDKTVLQYYRAELSTAREEFYSWLETRTPGVSGISVGEPYL